MGNEVEEIKSRLNIVDVLGEYIRLDKAGANWKATCPFHNEKTPSFMVNEERQMWKCFGCQKGGDIFAFVMEMEGVDFREALKILAEKAGVQLMEYNPKKTEEKNRTLEILDLAAKFWEYQLWEGPGKNKILKYLRERGLKDETIKEFRLGYAPKGWRNILQFLMKRGYKADEIVKAGLLIQKNNSQNPNDPNSKSNTRYQLLDTKYYDRFRERIIFPIADYSGKIVGFTARVTPGGDESQAKYVNTPETEVYHKSKILYGLDKAKSEIKKSNFAVMVEGNMDVIAAHQAGIKNTVAVSGTALTDEQAKIVKRYAPKIKLLFDMDAAGQVAAKKSLAICAAEDMQTEIVSLSSGKDAAEIAKTKPEELRKSIEKSKNAIEYFLEKSLKENDKNKPEGKRKISEIMAEMISSIANSVEKSHWIKTVAEKLETTEAALTDMLNKVSLKRRMAEKDLGVENDDFAEKSKKEILTEELIGLMFLKDLVIQEARKNKKEILIFSNDPLLSKMLEIKNNTGFDYDKLVSGLDSVEKNRAQKIYLAKKFRLDLNNNFEEYMPAEPILEFQNILKEIRKENLKAELQKISKDLKVAEEKKDRDATLYLREEFRNISQKLAEELNN